MNNRNIPTEQLCAKCGFSKENHDDPAEFVAPPIPPSSKTLVESSARAREFKREIDDGVISHATAAEMLEALQATHRVVCNQAQEIERLMERSAELEKQLGIGVRSQFDEGMKYEREIARLRALLDGRTFITPDETPAPASKQRNLKYSTWADVLQALEDLSFECDGVTATRAPSRETYNRAFQVLSHARACLGVNMASQYVGRTRLDENSPVETEARRGKDIQERFCRAFNRLSCADVPRGPWHDEVCDILLFADSPEKTNSLRCMFVAEGRRCTLDDDHGPTAHELESQPLKAASGDRLPARPIDQRVSADVSVRCAFCDQGILPGEVFDSPRQCCDPGREADVKHLNGGAKP